MKMGLCFAFCLKECTIISSARNGKYYNATIVICEVSTMHFGMVFTQNSKILSRSLQYILEEWKGISLQVSSGTKSENKGEIEN